MGMGGFGEGWRLEVALGVCSGLLDCLGGSLKLGIRGMI